MTDIDRLAEANYASRDPEYDESEIDAPEFDSEEWATITEDTWQLKEAIRILKGLADGINDPFLVRQAQVVERRFNSLIGDLDL